MEAPPVVQYWAEDLPKLVDGTLRCPRCGRIEWTAKLAPYGIELACWICPVYVGVKMAR